MKITELAFTINAVTDVARARAFYEKVLGLKPTSVFEDAASGMAFIEYEVGGGTFTIGAGAPGYKPGPEGGTVAFEVEDFDKAVAALRAASAAFITEPLDTGACRMVLVKDPDGNNVMIHKRKKN